MQTPKHWQRWLPWVLMAGLGLIAVFLMVQARPTSAQSNGLQLEKSLLKDSNVVQVGETLTFAITITNNWNTSVITLPMIDEFDESVLRFLDASLAPDTAIQNTGVLSWNNVLQSTGPLSPGNQLVILVRFVAEHPSPQVVNRAYTHDAYDFQGNAVGDAAAQDDNIAQGGNSPLTKTLALGVVPRIGELITFNLTIGNAGAANILTLPVRDRFDPAVLQYVSSEPAIDGEAPGVLVWSNALRPPLPGVLLPLETATLTVTFRVIGDVQQTTNQAEVIGATDAFGNDLAPAADDVPIRIVDASTATPTPTPIRPRPTVVAPEATATPASTVEATAVVSATMTPETTAIAPDTTAPAGGLPIVTATPTAPGSLPDTGDTSSIVSQLLTVAVLLAIAGWLMRLRSKERQ